MQKAGLELRNPAVARSVNVIRLPSKASADHDHEAMLQDIIRLPHEVRVDHDHESQIHGIIRLPHEVRLDHDHELQVVHDITKLLSYIRKMNKNRKI